MTKEEFVKVLQENGINPVYEGGKIIVYSPDKKVMRRMREIAQSVGYDGTYGWSGRVAGTETGEN